MQTSTLQSAIAAAKQFIAAAEKTKPATAYWAKDAKTFEYQEHGKHVAATKRASMELTRALADLRANR